MTENPKKKKVLFIITKSNLGGAQRYVFDLATNLPKEHYEPVVALGGKGVLNDKLLANGIQTISLDDLERNVNIIKEFTAFLNIYRTIKKLNPDVVHLNSSKAGALGALAARLYNLFHKLSTLNFQLSTSKVIFTAHGWAFKEKRKFVFRKIIEYISWITVLLCDITIVVSDDDRNRVKKFLFVQSKIRTIHNGIGKLTFKNRDEARKILADKIKKNIPSDTICTGTIAELHKNKGIEHAISAYALIKRQETSRNVSSDKIIYIVIGEGEERKNLELLIERENLQEMVYLAGGYQNAFELLKAFDIFILPSLKEGLPYALLEAGLAGLPIVATNVGGVAEVVEDMKSGIVIKEKRPQEIANAVTFLINNKIKMEEFSVQIHKIVQNDYTLDLMIKETVDVYNIT